MNSNLSACNSKSEVVIFKSTPTVLAVGGEKTSSTVVKGAESFVNPRNSNTSLPVIEKANKTSGFFCKEFP